MSAIPKRVCSALVALQERDFEASLLHCFPVIDKTAALRRPGQRVGVRFKSFIQDQFDIIAPIGLSVLVARGCTFAGMTYEDAIYDLARNNLMHEGEFHNSIKFTNGHSSILGGDWALSARNVLALIVSVVVAKENAGLTSEKDFLLPILDQSYSLNSLWGCETELREKIARRFRDGP